MNKQQKWFVGMKVVKTLHGLDGYTEKSEGTITKIDAGVIYVDDEWGITYGMDGRELQNFFPPMYSEIVPKELDNA